jgi:hypothetical protein
MALKLMYLAKRNPSFPSQESFRPRWRQHGALAMSLPTWTTGRRYVHADALPPSAETPPHDYDGVGIMWPDPNEGIFREPPTPESIETGAILLEDEMKAFAGPVMPLAVLTEEEVLKSGGLTDITAYLWFYRPDEAELAGAKFAKVTVPHVPERVAINRVMDKPLSQRPLNNYKGVVEVAARDRKELDAILAAAAVKADLIVITRECLLWHNGPVQQSVGSA